MARPLFLSSCMTPASIGVTGAPVGFSYPGYEVRVTEILPSPLQKAVVAAGAHFEDIAAYSHRVL